MAKAPGHGHVATTVTSGLTKIPNNGLFSNKDGHLKKEGRSAKSSYTVLSVIGYCYASLTGPAIEDAVSTGPRTATYGLEAGEDGMPGRLSTAVVPVKGHS